MANSGYVWTQRIYFDWISFSNATNTRKPEKIHILLKILVRDNQIFTSLTYYEKYTFLLQIWEPSANSGTDFQAFFQFNAKHTFSKNEDVGILRRVRDSLPLQYFFQSRNGIENTRLNLSYYRRQPQTGTQLMTLILP